MNPVTPPMEVVQVTFESALDPDEVEAAMRERAPEFRETDGLVQKFYVRDGDRYGGIYCFDSEEARDAYLDGDLRGSIAEAYDARGEPEVSTYHLVFPLRDAEGFPPRA